MTTPTRELLTLAATICLLFAVVAISSALGMLDQQEDSHVAGAIIIVMAWIAIIAAVLAIPLTLVRPVWGTKLVLFGLIAASPFAMLMSFPKLWCLIMGPCAEWDPPFPIEAGGIMVLGALAIAIVCQRRIVTR